MIDSNPLYKILSADIVIIGNETNRAFFAPFECVLKEKNSITYIKINDDDLEHSLPFAENGKIYNQGDKLLLKCDYLIVLLPIVKYESEDIFLTLNSYENLEATTIFVSCPEFDISNKFYSLLEKLYKQAIFIDYNLLYKYNMKVLSQIKDGKKFTLCSNKGTHIEFSMFNNVLCHESCILGEEKVFQLPGGEVFFPVDSKLCSGTLIFDNREYKIIDGKFYFDGVERIVGEFGIGTNPGLPYVRGIPVMEKARDTFHLGLGYNFNFGGEIKEKYHFDLVLTDCELLIDDKLFKWN